MNTSYYFKNPAIAFEEANLIGNGKKGATLFGGLDTERILINDDCLYSGHVRTEEEKVPHDLYKKWEKARECMLNGDLKECRRILTMEFNQGSSHKYLPLGNVYIEFNHDGATNYKRSLDFSKGISKVEYDFEGKHYIRECFAPFKENCIILNVKSSEKGSVSFKVRFETENKFLETIERENSVIYRGMAPFDHDREKTEGGMPIYFYPEKEGESISFAECIKPLVNGGKIKIEEGIISVEDADEATLYLFSETSYIDPYTKPEKDYVANIIKASDAFEYNLDSIKENHIKDFESLFSKVKLTLGEEKNMDVTERIKSFDGTDLGLYALLFNFGRYLMISSSREGSHAINLQGIWNKTMNPPWESTYTTNINLQMAYWPTFTAGLEKLWEPLVSYVESMVPMGEEVASRMYGVRGFAFHSNSDIWAHAYPCGGGILQSEQWSPWVLCSGWLCEQLFDGYEYTMDKKYLERVYPLMKKASLFYLDLLVEDTDKKLIFTPCSSPENRYYLGDDTFAIAKYTAIGQSIIKELFMHTLEALNILEVDKGFGEEISETLIKLKDVEIGSDGRLLEWDKEYKEQDVHHRHTSHVYGLYPGTTISVEKTPALAEACRKTLKMRGDDGTGWGLAWKINLYALLRDGNHAEKLLKNQLRFVDHNKKLDYSFGGSYSNLLDAHPPFQIDGNFGSVAAVLNMLIWSEMGKIILLPALPDDWKDGSIEGAVAKGNIKVSVIWENNKVLKASLVSPFSQEIELWANSKSYKINLKSNEAYDICF